MQNFPHTYHAGATAGPHGLVTLRSEGLRDLDSAPPAEFGGPGDEWSPETLLVAAVADCFLLTFRAIATASKLEWTALECTVSGQLDRVERAVQFAAFELRAVLDLPPDADAARAEKLLEKAKSNCFITNSLKASVTLVAEVRPAA
ncbi:MAG: OsmC family protein [Gammaproteobacteria bacterium]